MAGARGRANRYGTEWLGRARGLAGAATVAAIQENQGPRRERIHGAVDRDRLVRAGLHTGVAFTTEHQQTDVFVNPGQANEVALFVGQ